MTHMSVPKDRVTLEALVMLCALVSFPGCCATNSAGDDGFDIARSRFLGSVWNQGHAQASIISQDGGYSYAIPGGSLWWFGDTFRGTRDASGKPHFEGGGVSCSVALLDQADKAVPPVLNYLRDESGTVTQAIAFLPEETWDRYRIWPQGGCYVNGKSCCYFSLIELTGEGTWGFKGVGSGLACSSQPLSLHTRIRTPEGWRFPVEPTAVVADNDWLYLFEVQKRDGRQGAWLSRVRPGDIEKPAKYEFQCGRGDSFCGDKSKQVLLLDNVYGQTSVVWNDYLGKYVLAASSDLFHPREIRFHTADKPFGPWSDAVASVTVPGTRQGKTVNLVYCSYFHPELFRENGRIMILTFSLQLKDAGFDANNEVVELEIDSHHK